MKEIAVLAYLTVLSVFDVRENRVPISLLCMGTLAAIIWTLWRCLTDPGDVSWIVISAAAGMIPGGFLTAMAYLTKKTGYGDGWTLLNLGSLLGYRKGLLLLCFGVFLTACCCVALLALRKVDRHTKLPFLPFLTIVYVAGMLMGG